MKQVDSLRKKAPFRYEDSKEFGSAMILKNYRIIPMKLMEKMKFWSIEKKEFYEQKFHFCKEKPCPVQREEMKKMLKLGTKLRYILEGKVYAKRRKANT